MFFLGKSTHPSILNQLTSPKSCVVRTQSTRPSAWNIYITEIHSAASAGSPGSGGGVAVCLPATTVHSAPPTSAGTASWCWSWSHHKILNPRQNLVTYFCSTLKNYSWSDTIVQCVGYRKQSVLRPDAGCCEEDGAGDDDAGEQVVVHGQDVGTGPRVQEPDTSQHSSQILS